MYIVKLLQNLFSRKVGYGICCVAFQKIRFMKLNTFMELGKLLDHFLKHLSALDCMKLSKEFCWDTTVIYVIYNKLDKIIQNK